MDCFYASCERLRRPELADEPLVVGMGYEAGEAIGAVATASYEARAFGVESAMPISEALDLLPRRVNADPDDPDAPDPDEAGRYPRRPRLYKEVASDVKTVLRDCADVLREVSVDEAYLDVTDRTAWDAAGGESTATGPAETRTLAEGTPDTSKSASSARPACPRASASRRTCRPRRSPATPTSRTGWSSCHRARWSPSSRRCRPPRSTASAR